jgi:hypothetical protein
VTAAPPEAPIRTVELATGVPVAPPVAEAPVEAEVEALVEPMVEPEPEAFVAPDIPPPPAAEMQAPLVSTTLAELYFNQGFTEKAIEVYRQLLEREPVNARARARLIELEALDRHLRAEERPAAAPPPARPAEAAPTDPRSLRRQAIERTITRLEGFLAALRKG